MASVLHTAAVPDETRLPIWWTVSCGFRLPGTWSMILREVICPTFAVAPWRDENHRRLPVLDACQSLSLSGRHLPAAVLDVYGPGLPVTALIWMRTQWPHRMYVVIKESNESIGIRKVRNARGPHTLMKLSHRRQVPSESFVTMCPGLLGKTPCAAMVRNAALVVLIYPRRWWLDRYQESSKRPRSAHLGETKSPKAGPVWIVRRNVSRSDHSVSLESGSTCRRGAEEAYFVEVTTDDWTVPTPIYERVAPGWYSTRGGPHYF